MVQSSRRTSEAKEGEQQKWRGGQDGKDGTDDAQTQKEEASQHEDHPGQSMLQSRLVHRLVTHFRPAAKGNRSFFTTAGAKS